MKCLVCGDYFKSIQVRREEKNGFERHITYYKCNLCGCGRIDYPPFLPVDEIGDD